jgi:hypothetical protein
MFRDTKYKFKINLTVIETSIILRNIKCTTHRNVKYIIIHEIEYTDYICRHNLTRNIF